MKKLFLVLGLLLGASVARADFNVFNSSAVETNVTNKRLWVGRGTLHAVIVASTGTASGITLYDGESSTNFIRKISTIQTIVDKTCEFDVAVSSGLTFTTTGTQPAKLSVIFKAGQ